MGCTGLIQEAEKIMFQFVKAWKERRAQQKLLKAQARIDKKRKEMCFVPPKPMPPAPRPEWARKDVSWPWEGK